MSKKSSRLEFMIVVLGGILKNLVDITEEQPEPDFIETSMIHYQLSPDPEPPEIPENRPDIFRHLKEEPVLLPSRPVPRGFTQF